MDADQDFGLVQVRDGLEVGGALVAVAQFAAEADERNLHVDASAEDDAGIRLLDESAWSRR